MCAPVSLSRVMRAFLELFVSIVAAKAIGGAAFGLGRATCPARAYGDALLGRGRRRRMIGIQQARLRGSQAFVRKLQDLPDDLTARRKSADLVAHAQRVTRPRRLAVHAHVVRFAGRLGERARFEQARSK